MSRLSLVIADSDTGYLAEFEKFMMIHYPQQFDIFSFSSPGALSGFLASSDKKDILLINKKIYKKELQLKNIDDVLLLSDDRTDHLAEGPETLFKYRHAEKLVADVLRLHALKSAKACSVSGHSNTRVVCVYSPSGGAGKSSIAAGCSIVCARKGLKTFYLNMEDIPSTDLFFRSEAEQSFSNVIYHLKGKGHNLGLKLEGAKSCDIKTGVCYFAPPDSILELEELSDQDIVNLVNELKGNAVYDMVFADMSCVLDKRSLALLGCADTILLILSHDEISDIKLKKLEAAVDILKSKYGSQMSDHMITVLNKYEEKFYDVSSLINARTKIGISECKVRRVNGHTGLPVENPSFIADMNRLLEVILSKNALASTAAAGGESIA
ncbi:MAG: chromosome partitioning protein [Clostridiaceae bacterium]